MKAAEQIRLSGNSDTGLKIKAVSSDDLYIFAEIAKKVLLESEKLSTEINQLMTNILTKAKVKTAERENVNINLRIPKSKDLYVPTSVKIELKKCIPLNTEGLLRNCILAGNNIVVTEIGKGLRICKIDGTFDRTIKLEKVRYVNRLFLIDCNTIAVSYRLRSVDVLDLSTGLVKNTTELNISNTDYEIAYEDGLMYVVEYGDKFTSDSNEKEKKVIVMNLSGKVIRNIFVSSNRWGNTSVSTDSNRLFSISKNNLVYCYDLKGILKWKFQPDKPCYIESIATYEDGQLFVVIKGSILLLSSDGKSLDVVLTLEHSKHKSDLYYDKALKLLVYYDTNNVFLYQVKH
ncbi:uncharacterized protein LOC127720597 [Mytilus californianus]|uniref:uncharacterized protein LOC127720597 n=1 Tax=Mytilus californianus TaxID=6549 RepID=UPI0022486857|nr:uncharacterized protein LOC127720597 [Mytilus californianus]XP_052083226.1 uncharacterized protein LOC127720597 [Mytilus californianus]